MGHKCHHADDVCMLFGVADHLGSYISGLYSIPRFRQVGIDYDVDFLPSYRSMLVYLLTSSGFCERQFRHPAEKTMVSW